jgi:putative flippase GtrA
MAGDRPGLRQTASFGVIGVAATVLYFVVATAASASGLKAMLSSLLAYGVSSLFSYLGHRWLTFRSAAPVTETGPRFALLTLLQYGLAVALPALLTDLAGFAPGISFAAVCLVAPLVSFVVMSRFVFRPAEAGSDRILG